MADLKSEIEWTLSSSGRIPREKVVKWIEEAGDLRTLSLLYRLTDVDYHRVEPELGRDATCGLIQRYLLECMRERVSDDEEILEGFDAARTLNAWFLHLLQKGGNEDVLRTAAGAVTELFLNGDEGLQNLIETGFLEHVLDTEGLRPYFEHWATDDRLRSVWEPALAWGKAHPDQMAQIFGLSRHKKPE